jgi:hypothetical protein
VTSIPQSVPWFSLTWLRNSSCSASRNYNVLYTQTFMPARCGRDLSKGMDVGPTAALWRAGLLSGCAGQKSGWAFGRESVIDQMNETWLCVLSTFVAADTRRLPRQRIRAAACCHGFTFLIILDDLSQSLV